MLNRCRKSSVHCQSWVAFVTDLSQFNLLLEEYLKHDAAKFWDIHVSDKVVNPSTRRESGATTRCEARAERDAGVVDARVFGLSVRFRDRSYKAGCRPVGRSGRCRLYSGPAGVRS